MAEFYSQRAYITTLEPQQASIDLARAACASSVLAESLAAGDKSLVLTFPAAMKQDTETLVFVYGCGEGEPDGE